MPSTLIGEPLSAVNYTSHYLLDKTRQPYSCTAARTRHITLFSTRKPGTNITNEDRLQTMRQTVIQPMDDSFRMPLDTAEKTIPQHFNMIMSILNKTALLTTVLLNGLQNMHLCAVTKLNKIWSWQGSLMACAKSSKLTPDIHRNLKVSTA
jgi:hypothetical protein